MKATRLAIPDVVLLEPSVFEDARGCFFESFSQREFERLTGVSATFVQDNHSVSRKDVLRGLHFQVPPHVQGKLVRVVRGAIFDVAVDIREQSPTYHRWVGQRIGADTREQIWIPPVSPTVFSPWRMVLKFFTKLRRTMIARASALFLGMILISKLIGRRARQFSRARTQRPGDDNGEHLRFQFVHLAMLLNELAVLHCDPSIAEARQQFF